MNLTIVTGSPGAGKSTFAALLAVEEKACLLDIDTASEKLVRAGLAACGKDPADRDSQYFKATYRAPIYDTLFELAAANLNSCPVIIVGPFTREIRNPDWLRELEQKFACPVKVIYIYCPPEIRRERIIARANPRDSQKLSSWDEFNKYYGSEAPPAFSHIFIDSTSESGF